MFGRREGAEIRLKAKSRHGLMSVVIFDHQEVSNKAKSFVASIANGMYCSSKLRNDCPLHNMFRQPEEIRIYFLIFAC